MDPRTMWSQVSHRTTTGATTAAGLWHCWSWQDSSRGARQRCAVRSSKGSRMRRSHASQKYQTEHAKVGEAIADQCVDGRDATRGEARQKDGFIGCERIRGRQHVSLMIHRLRQPITAGSQEGHPVLDGAYTSELCVRAAGRF